MEGKSWYVNCVDIIVISYKISYNMHHDVCEIYTYAYRYLLPMLPSTGSTYAFTLREKQILLSKLINL